MKLNVLNKQKMINPIVRNIVVAIVLVVVVACAYVTLYTNHETEVDENCVGDYNDTVIEAVPESCDVLCNHTTDLVVASGKLKCYCRKPTVEECMSEKRRIYSNYFECIDDVKYGKVVFVSLDVIVSGCPIDGPCTKTHLNPYFNVTDVGVDYCKSMWLEDTVLNLNCSVYAIHNSS